MTLKDKVAIVTGGAQGIGKCVVRALLERGAAVTIADSDLEASVEAVAELGGLGRLSSIPTDVSDEGAVSACIRQAVAGLGRLDLLVNNAAVSAGKPLGDLALDEWNRVIAVNLTGPFLCAKHAAPALRKSRGSIVNIASTRAFMSEPNTEAYSASKGGLVALTHALAASLAPDVRVNCIAPGWIDVSGWKKSADRKAPVLSDADHRQHWAGRVGRPEDIAELVCFLASDGAGFVTGSCMVADGGMTRKMICV